MIPDRSADAEKKKSEFSWGPAPDAPAAPEAADTDAEQPEADAEEAADAVPAEPAELRRPRHVKPDQGEELDGNFSLLIVNGGSKRGVEPADVIELVTSKGSLTGSDVRRVRVLSRYTLMQVPTDKAADVAGAISGSQLRGEKVAAEAVLRDAAE